VKAVVAAPMVLYTVGRGMFFKDPGINEGTKDWG
jgi:hypothetical protein